MEAKFIGEVADIYKCIVCHLVLKDPVLVIECGHRLCKLCFESMQKYAEDHNNPLQCPHDRKEVEVEKVVDDKGVGRTVLDLQVYCNNDTEGCNWSGELRQLENHVDNQCRVTALKNFMERTERRLDEKEKEVRFLSEQISSKDVEIKKLREETDQRISGMEKYLKDVESQLCQKDEEIALLKYELAGVRIESLRCGGSEQRQSSVVGKSKKRKIEEKIVAAGKENMACLGEKGGEGSSAVFLEDQAEENIKSLTMEVRKLDRKLSRLEFKTAGVNSELLQMREKQMDGDIQGYKHGCSTDCDHCREIRKLTERVMNVDTYIPDDRTIFVWKVKNFSHHEKNKAQLNSPDFYSSIRGHCCVLYLKWKDNNDLGVYIKFRRGLFEPDKFNMSMTVSSTDRNGKQKSMTTPREVFTDSAEKYIVKLGETESAYGRGFSSYLKYPALAEFVIDDTLTLHCELKN